MRHKILTIMAPLVIGMAGSTGALQAGTTYTSDGNLADQTAGVGQYATFSNFSAGEVSSPFTPTAAELAADEYRVWEGGSLPGLPDRDWILATFSASVASIRVFPNIDHFGASYDGYQYSIYGSNNGTTWTPLFDVLSVAGSGEPFTIGSFTGTAPSRVNNVLTPGAGVGGTVGYEADFTFSSAYSEYAFGSSTFAVNSGNANEELSAVAVLSSPVPDGLPGGSCVWLIAGLGMLGLFGRAFPSARLSRAN